MLRVTDNGDRAGLLLHWINVVAAVYGKLER